VRVSDDIALDFDAAGKLVGVDVTNGSAHLDSGVELAAGRVWQVEAYQQQRKKPRIAS
jgi:uncharacterized protein YuzE